MTFAVPPLLFGLIAALFFGMSKTGVPGIGMLGVLLMLLAFPGAEKLSSGAVIPLLIIADTFAVRYYWRYADWERIKQLLPTVVVGLCLGTAFMRVIDHSQFRIILAVLILALVAFEQLRRWRKWNTFPKSRWFARSMGMLCGFTTLVGNAGGPVMTIYCAAQNFNKHDFMGTFAVFFFMINVTKLPLMAGAVPGLHLVTAETLWFNVLVLPGLFVGVVLGRRLFHVIPERYFVPCVLMLNLLMPLHIILF
jgi:uncharacterized membrane protein YfcA